MGAWAGKGAIPVSDEDGHVYIVHVTVDGPKSATCRTRIGFKMVAAMKTSCAMTTRGYGKHSSSWAAGHDNVSIVFYKL